MEMIHYHFETLPSTNDWAKQHLHTFARDKLTIVTADEQRRGRGQYGRQWNSPKGENLYASFCFFNNKQDPLLLTRAFALLVADVLERHGVVCQFKKPNDLLVKGKKIAGILCETEPFAPEIGIVIGLGLNINMSEEDLGEIDQPATSLKAQTGKEWEIASVLQEILHNLSPSMLGTTTRPE